MDAEQMDLLERLARLRELGAISRGEFRREKTAILRTLPRAVPVPLRALPLAGAVPGSAAAASSVVPYPRPRLPRFEPDTPFQRIARIAGWALWTLFSLGGLDALLERDALLALALLLCGLLFAPPLHRLLATRMGMTARIAITTLGVLAALGIGAAPDGEAAQTAAPVAPTAAAACGKVVSHMGARSERARDGIARPWRKFWGDLGWARVAGSSLYEEWRETRKAG